MKIHYLRIILGLTIILAVEACVNDRKEEKKVTDPEAYRAEDIEAKPTSLAETPWIADFDTVTQKYSMVQSEVVGTSQLDSSNVLQAINRKYPDIHMEWKSRSGDTAYVSIPEASILTQQSGTFGAQIYLAESTYSITEIPGIKWVSFDFKVGDHATPGVYHRESFDFSQL